MLQNLKYTLEEIEAATDFREEDLTNASEEEEKSDIDKRIDDEPEISIKTHKENSEIDDKSQKGGYVVIQKQIAHKKEGKKSLTDVLFEDTTHYVCEQESIEESQNNIMTFLQDNTEYEEERLVKEKSERSEEIDSKQEDNEEKENEINHEPAEEEEEEKVEERKENMEIGTHREQNDDEERKENMEIEAHHEQENTHVDEEEKTEEEEQEEEDQGVINEQGVNAQEQEAEEEQGFRNTNELGINAQEQEEQGFVVSQIDLLQVLSRVAKEITGSKRTSPCNSPLRDLTNVLQEKRSSRREKKISSKNSVTNVMDERRSSRREKKISSRYSEEEYEITKQERKRKKTKS